MRTGLIAVFFLAGVGLAMAQEKTSALVTTARIDLPTIQCDMCVMNVEEALKDVRGVQKVDVDLEQKRAVVLYRPAQTDLRSLEVAVTIAGYDANKQKADPQAYERLPGCCKMPEQKDHSEG